MTDAYTDHRVDPAAMQTGLLLAREGRLDEALAHFRDVGGTHDKNALAMMYMVTRVTGDRTHSLELCDAALPLDDSPVHTSTWTLRRALLLVELEDEKRAVLEFTKVISLRASDDQVQQAQAALLQLSRR